MLINKILGFCTFLVLVQVLNADREHPAMKTTKLLSADANEASSEFWTEQAQAWLAEKLRISNAEEATKPAKNVILFLGDGMSLQTFAATRSFMGDPSKKVYFETFPYLGLSRTYCVDKQVPDSACTATAYLGGVKGNYGTIGVNAKVLRSDCETGTNPANFVESIAKWAMDANKDAGLVTTARVTHASPAGVYAHTANRDWENNAEVLAKGCNDEKVVDIARQLVEWDVGKRLKVIMGGGRRNFRDKSVNDEEGYKNKRTDGRDLIKEWLREKRQDYKKAEYVWNRKGLSLVNLNTTDYLLGLFCNNHCPYNGDRARQYTSGVYPSLTEMTEAAIKVLQRNENGYFLFVEGARIDMAHHDTKAVKSLEDTEEFAKAIRLAREMTSTDDTLIVVTSDHSHTMTINGYPSRKLSITGLSDIKASDNLPYTILSYANGPGYETTLKRYQTDYDMADEIENANFLYPATVPLDSETHGADDVAVFASGPYAQYFSGNYEESNIPAMMAKAANIGPFANL